MPCSKNSKLCQKSTKTICTIYFLNIVTNFITCKKFLYALARIIHVGYTAFCSGHNELEIKKKYSQELGHKILIMILNMTTNGTAELRVSRLKITTDGSAGLWIIF